MQNQMQMQMRMLTSPSAPLFPAVDAADTKESAARLMLRMESVMISDGEQALN